MDELAIVEIPVTVDLLQSRTDVCTGVQVDRQGLIEIADRAVDEVIARRLGQICDDLEVAVEKGNDSEIKALVDRFVPEFEEVKTALKKIKAEA